MSLTWEEKLHKTEQKQEDRRQALERMGISVQSSGIKVHRILIQQKERQGVSVILYGWAS